MNNKQYGNSLIFMLMLQVLSQLIWQISNRSTKSWIRGCLLCLPRIASHAHWMIILHHMKSTPRILRSSTNTTATIVFQSQPNTRNPRRILTSGTKLCNPTGIYLSTLSPNPNSLKSFSACAKKAGFCSTRSTWVNFERRKCLETRPIPAPQSG